MADSAPAGPQAPPTTRSPLWLGGVLFLVTLAASAWFVGQMVGYGERIEHQHGLSVANTTAALLDPGEVAALRGEPGDAGTPAHDAVRADLRAVLESNPEFRFVYLMRPLPGRTDRFVFLADGEDPTSPDYSAPGDVYEGPSHDLRRVVESGQSLFSGVVHDEWGSFVSALAPVTDAEGRLLAVLGIDIEQHTWMDTQARYRSFGLAISGLVLALVALFLVGLQLQRQAAQRQAGLGQRLAEQLGELQLAQEGLRMADIVVRKTSEAIMVLDPQMRIVSVNPAWERLTGLRGADVVGLMPPSLTRDPALLARLKAAIDEGDHWEGEVWGQRPDGTRYPTGALAEVVRDDAGAITHFVVVLQDVAAQKELEERLRELSATDGLTHIANRRAFDDALVHEWERALRNGGPLSVVMADIDFFKRYNDQYGHVAGGVCLQQVAAALKAGIRQGGDFVGRYGGEEFVVVLPGADADAARAVAESLRQRVEALALPHEGNPATGVVTISLGVATCEPVRGREPTTLVEAADKQLYRAKQGGRNRVEAAG
ncbi:diguanylate cyclase domain-containing protein [Arenimonas sp.]|uniref:sensor domain-containing diguanylate cyclase n=1 Tax=Arenimonas sp. TaxID=1872635 RepID=UPI0035ADEB23